MHRVRLFGLPGQRQAVKNLARFIRSEINVAARLEGNAKEKNEQTKREKQKGEQMLSKKCATKKLYVQRGMTGKWKRRGLWPGSIPQCPSKFAAHQMRIEFILFRTPSSSSLWTPSLLGLLCCPYQPKSETFRA